MHLNRYQQRALAITLRLLEERLDEIENLIDRGHDGVLYRRPRAPFSAEQHARVEELIAEIRGAVVTLAGAYDLPSERQDPVRRIAGLLNITWESLGELDARRLAAYGAVDPEVRTTLEPATRRLAELVLELHDVAVGPADRSTEEALAGAEGHPAGAEGHPAGTKGRTAGTKGHPAGAATRQYDSAKRRAR